MPGSALDRSPAGPPAPAHGGGPRKYTSRPSPRRLRILWIVLGAMLIASALPLWLYHRRVLSLTDDKLQDAERVQQSEITRSLASETAQFVEGLRQQLINEQQMLSLTGWVQDVDDPAHTPQISQMLHDLAQSDPGVLYITAVNQAARGISQGSFRGDADPFVQAELKRAFTASIQGYRFTGQAFALGRTNRPAVVISVPLFYQDQFTGMVAAVVSLDRVEQRLREESVRDRTVFIVDKHGQVVAHPDHQNFVPGRDMSALSPLVKQFKDSDESHAIATNILFTAPPKDGGAPTEMIGTFSPIPELGWAVIAQRSLTAARVDAGMSDLTVQALSLLAGVTIMALLFGYLFALGITRPIRGLVESTRAISRAEFHERVPVRGAAEISELAETFNHMAGDIERFVEELKDAAEQNRDLFLGSIRMLAAAIDEKDPYTRGHSGRVAKYSMILGEILGMSTQELDTLRISALLHDVGKIGVDDRVLKKPGKLTDEEFEMMKQHTVKGANIMRPVAQLREVLPGIELHHERMDGGGYPYGLVGDKIPLMARIIAVADTMDAITTNRPYQSAMDLEYALSRIRSLAVSKFDPKVVGALDTAVHSGRLHLSAALVEV